MRAFLESQRCKNNLCGHFRSLCDAKNNLCGHFWSLRSAKIIYVGISGVINIGIIALQGATAECVSDV